MKKPQVKKWFTMLHTIDSVISLHAPTSHSRISVRHSAPTKTTTLWLNNHGDDVNVNNLLVPISSILSVASLGTLWSEYSVILTGCGPRSLPDVVERSCYLGALVGAGSSVFLRIVSGNGLATVIESSIEKKRPDGAAKDTSGIVLQIMRAAEYLSFMTIVGAFVALGSQTIHGEQMDGMSGINIDMCKAMQQLDD